jgi:Uma2 family endonuclease
VNDGPHTRHFIYFMDALLAHLSGREGYVVLGDHRVDFGVRGLRPLGPDVIAFSGVRGWEEQSATFQVAEFGARPELVIEITSPETRRNDLGIKERLYSRARVAYYAIVDLHAGPGQDQIHLLGYERVGRRLAAATPDRSGRLWLPSVESWLGVEGDQAFLYDTRGRRYDGVREALRAQQAAEARARSEARARRAEARARRVEEQARREAEARLQSLEERVRQLEVQLRRAPPAEPPP